MHFDPMDLVPVQTILVNFSIEASCIINLNLKHDHGHITRMERAKQFHSEMRKQIREFEKLIAADEDHVAQVLEYIGKVQARYNWECTP